MSDSQIGAKRLVVGAHYGLKDWLMQRLTAVIMALYTIVLFVFFLITPTIDYRHWVALLANPWMKIISLLALFSLFYHAWVGVRDIFMDYIKPLSIRLLLQVLTVCWLLGCAVYSAQILWGV